MPDGPSHSPLPTVPSKGRDVHFWHILLLHPLSLKKLMVTQDSPQDSPVCGARARRYKHTWHPWCCPEDEPLATTGSCPASRAQGLTHPFLGGFPHPRMGLQGQQPHSVPIPSYPIGNAPRKRQMPPWTKHLGLSRVEAVPLNLLERMASRLFSLCLFLTASQCPE